MSLRVNTSGQSNSLDLELHSAAGKKGTDFNNILSQTRQLQSQELELFLNRLTTQGKRLSETMSLQDLVEFKNMITSFLKSTLGKSRNMQEETIWDYRGQPKVMSRVAKINQALEELGEQVLSAQAEPLKILSRIDEIKGLIINLFA